MVDSNLIRDLTVFVLSSEEETLGDCLQALEQQNCRFRIEQIATLHPMSRAFQAMPDRCRTRYFIQVDADMLLYPHAVMSLYQAIRQTPFSIFMVAGQLEEEGFGLGGAVKCWKRGLFRFFGFHDVRAIDRDLFRRTAWLGLRYQKLSEVLGIHHPRHSSFSTYVKAKSDVEKWRFLKRPTREYALPLLDTLLAGYPQTRTRLIGALLGALTNGRRLSRSKDLSYERKLFGQLSLTLGNWETSQVWSALEYPDIQMIRRAFAANYEMPHRKTHEARSRLANILLTRFAQPVPKTCYADDLLTLIADECAS